jgi:hypothetical protein
MTRAAVVDLIILSPLSRFSFYLLSPLHVQRTNVVSIISPAISELAGAFIMPREFSRNYDSRTRPLAPYIPDPLRAGLAAADRDGRKRYRAIAPEYESRDLSGVIHAVGRFGYRPVRRGHFRGFAVGDERLTARSIIDVI